jgi:hypothetical protein
MHTNDLMVQWVLITTSKFNRKKKGTEMWGYNDKAKHRVAVIVLALAQIWFSGKYMICAIDKYN